MDLNSSSDLHKLRRLKNSIPRHCSRTHEGKRANENITSS